MKRSYPNGLTRFTTPRFTLSDITPLTYRDGESYVSLLWRLFRHITEVLNPSLETSFRELITQLEAEMAKAEQQYVDGVHEFQRIHDAFMSDVNAHLIAMNDAAVADLVDDGSSKLGATLRAIFPDNEKFDEFRSNINTQHQELADDVDTFKRDTNDRLDRFNTTMGQEFTKVRDDVDEAISKLHRDVSDQLGTQLADMVLNDPDTRKSLSQMLSREDVVRTEFSQLGARILVGTLNNHGPDGNQGTVSGGPYQPYWQFSKNVSHQDWGFDRVETTDTNIIIHTTSPGVNKRIIGGTIIANVDESMALENYFIGGSGGGGRTVLNIGRSKTISDRVQYRNGRWESSRGVVTPRWNSDGQHLILEHEKMYGQAGGHVTFWPRSDHFSMPAIVAQNNTQTIVNFWGANGSKASSPHEGMGLHFSKSDSNAVQINPKEVMVRNGNIWFTLIQMYVPENWNP